MKIPYAENAYVPESKITLYLLNLEHRGGGKEKAQFFTRFGFSVAQWEIMRDSLLEHGRTHEVASSLETAEGFHYAIEGELQTPDKRNPSIRTVWALETDSTRPRFITAYPLK